MERRKNLETNFKANVSPFKAIHVGARMHLPAEDIVLIEADTNYSHIHLLDGKKLTVAVNIQKLQERFLGVRNMFRIHRSYMVNLHYLQGVIDYQVHLENGLIASVSRRKFNDLVTLLSI